MSDIQTVVDEYLRDDGGQVLELSEEHRSTIKSLMVASEQNYTMSELVTAENCALSNQINADNTRLSNQVRASQEATAKGIYSLGGMVSEGFAATMAKLDQIDKNIAQLGNSVNAVNENVYIVAKDLADLRQSFCSYIEEDRKIQAMQQATSDITNIRLELDERFGSHAKIRKHAVGILRSRDLGVVRTDTIITETEKDMISASDYWLASALISLAYWIDSSTGKDSGLAKDNAAKALNEAFRLDRQKTSLLFGLINLRANKRDEAARWFGTYLSFQTPEKVDHTMMLLLNICSSGVLVGTEANDLVIGQLTQWINEIDNSSTRTDIIAFWKVAISAKSVTASIREDRFRAIDTCCSAVADDMKAALRGSYLHGVMRNDLERTLANRDLVEEETWARIDDMLYNLAGNFAGEELPLRREYEYQNLIINLDGNVKLAQQLRSIKNSVLSETKRFIDVMNHAAYDSELSGSSAETTAMATRLEMPWIKEGYMEVAQELTSRAPNSIPIAVGGFNATTTDGSDEKRITAEFKKFVDDNERAELAKAAASPLHMGLGIGGAVAAIIGLIMFLVGIGLGGLLLIFGIAAAGYGVSKILKARKAQQEVKDRAKSTLRNGVIVLREVCREIREWTADFQAHQADQVTTETYMDQIIKESVDAAAFAASRR